MTDDGTYGQKGLITEGIEKVINSTHIDKCYAIGPAIMMKFVCELTKNTKFQQMSHLIPSW